MKIKREEKFNPVLIIFEDNSDWGIFLSVIKTAIDDMVKLNDRIGLSHFREQEYKFLQRLYSGMINIHSDRNMSEIDI